MPDEGGSSERLRGASEWWEKEGSEREKVGCRPSRSRRAIKLIKIVKIEAAGTDWGGHIQAKWLLISKERPEMAP